VALLGCGESQLSDTSAGVATTVRADASCQLLPPSEALIGVSPEGEAWVEGDEGVRLVLPDGTSSWVDAGFTRADAIVAWDTRAAYVVGDNSLWSTTAEGAEPMSLPPELGKPRFVCGDPGRPSGAFVITTRGLFERLDEVWLRWDFPVELLESMEIRDLAGACAGQDSTMYVEAGGALWEVRYGDLASFREATQLGDVSAVGPDVRIGFVGLRQGELVRFDGLRWATIPFDEGEVTAASASDGVLWAATDALLYRRNRFDRWEQLDAPMWPTTIDEVRGYSAGGAWLVRQNQLCHVEPRDTVRIDGVRPYGRLPEGSGLSLSVFADPETTTSLTARLDGGGVAVNGASGAWSIQGPDALVPGWHTLTLSVASPKGAVERSVKFLVEGGEEVVAPPMPPGDPTVFWSADIRPLYERSCAPCHGEGGNQTFMGSFEAFSALGDLALDRVSNAEMPPASASSFAPPLSTEEVQLLQTWVEEGMNP
jgi:mono/diheme cytochrome c family protein